LDIIVGFERIPRFLMQNKHFIQFIRRNSH